MKRIVAIIAVLALCVAFAGIAGAAARVWTLEDLDALEDWDTLTKAEIMPLLEQAYVAGFEAALATTGTDGTSVTRGLAFDGLGVLDATHIEGCYVLNTNSHRFHYPECGSVPKISEDNRQDYYGSRDEVIAMGYKPCGNCNP